MTIRILLFGLINFAALAIGGFFTVDGVISAWYTNLEQAPWTPTGWVFGAAWTTVMVFFSFYMAYAWDRFKNRKGLLIVFTSQWVLNIMWNPIFFEWHLVLQGLITISALTVLVGYLLFGHRHTMKKLALLVLPYFVWLLIATSLNAYILVNN